MLSSLWGFISEHDLHFLTQDTLGGHKKEELPSAMALARLCSCSRLCFHVQMP